MLSYHYALITNPCERTVRALLDYMQDHPGCLDTLDPEDSCAARLAISEASVYYAYEYPAEAKAFVLRQDQRV